jgi:hypothetical protein
VSLFDVGDLSRPKRIAKYSLAGAHSEAEFDPHAFLYWPPSGLLVVPLQMYTAIDVAPGDPAVKAVPSIGAVILRVGNGGIAELGFVTHPYSNRYGQGSQIRRSLIVDDTLWTVSDGGLLATQPNSLARAAWIPFD